MKAIIVTEFGQPEVLKYTDIEIPVINSKQVLIKVEKASVNFADIKSRYGKKGGKLPFIPGLDAAGVIESVGSEVQSFKVGQRVIAFPSAGSYAEYVVAEENLTFSIPDRLDFQTAAACPTVSFLSYKLLVDIARIEKGETVLVHSAAGGVGTTAIQLAKILGASKVIGTVGSESKSSVALEAGADQVICYETEDFAQKVNEYTDGKGVNIILDSIAGWVSEKSLDCLAPYGRLVHFGNSSGKAGNFKTNDLHSSCRSVLGFSLGTTRKERPHLLQETAKQVLQLLADGHLHIKIGHHFPLQDAVSAHKLIESRQSVGKVLLDVKH
ncbi:zinc-binding alcohol dehydrogenase family protein [Bacillus sp. CGMCC 1.16607]|uniref:quinone oxidoreductase family protein n=1 Tax=Bacillus sp. CGMCC 1.16607 TaxID=3351842 RepID=UPI003643F1D3